MEKIPTALDDRLLDYLDGNLDETDLHQLKMELEKSPMVKSRLEELRLLHETLMQTRLESPSPAFTTKVMQNLHRLPFSSTLSPRNGLLLLAGMIAAAGILVVMISAGTFDQFKGMVSLKQLSPVQKYFQQSLPSFSVNGKLIINIIVGINLVLAFIILDRTILRPFFQRRAGTQV